MVQNDQYVQSEQVIAKIRAGTYTFNFPKRTIPDWGKIRPSYTTYFENLIVELHILYALNTHVKFCVNWILFTI